MQNEFAKKTLIRFSAPMLLAVAIAAALAGCADNTGSLGGGSTTPTDPGAPAPAPVVGTLALGTDKNFILADNASTATLTATLVDTSNALMPGATITFATTTGNLSASSATTDANGQATVTLKSGLADYSNRTAVVTASAGGQSASVPIDITGSTVTLAVTPGTSIQVGAGTLTATATVANASGLGLANQSVRFSVGAASTGAATLSASVLTTNTTGVTQQLTVTPTAAGTIVLTAEWLNSAGTTMAIATSNIDVTPAAGLAFAVTIPATNPTALTSGATQLVTVTVPADIAGTAVSNVRLSATSGSLAGITQVTASSGSILQTPASGLVAATYTAPAASGSVTIQVDALDAVGATLSTLSRTFVISAPALAAAQMFLGATPSVVAPSSGGNARTATLTVTVRDPTYNTVGGAAVLFGLLATTGSGETVSPAVVLTNSAGEATSIFSAGTAATVGDIYAQARIVGETCTFDPATADPATETNPLCVAIPLKVSSQAVSVTVGFGTTVADNEYDATQYRQPGSVIVLDSNGGPVAGATVTLSAFPAYYRNGIIELGRIWNGSTYELGCTGVFNTASAYWDPLLQTNLYGATTAYVAAEDINRNGILDLGEDTPIAQNAAQLAAQAISNNGLLSPPHAAGGTVTPATVVTDANGAASFDLRYLKAHAWFIKTEVTARVDVMGTEHTARTLQPLKMSQPDAESDICTLAREATY